MSCLRYHTTSRAKGQCERYLLRQYKSICLGIYTYGNVWYNHGVKHARTDSRGTRGGKMKNVLLLLDIGGDGNRQRLIGIFRYMRQASTRWDIEIISPNYYQQSRHALVDGVIVVEDDATATVLHGRAGVTPVVALDADPALFAGEPSNITRIDVDNAGIARMAADHLFSSGKLRSLAYVPARGAPYWSRERDRTVEQEAVRRGVSFHRFSGSNDEMAKWLLSIPLPTGILAANLRRAADVLTASKIAKIDVPKQMALMGVDNEELFCDYTTPSISSVDIDFEKEGYMAASELDALIRAKTPRTMKTLLLPPQQIIERKSTTPTVPATIIVERAVAFIKANATRGIGVADVVREMRVSRRLADLRFRQLQGETINGCIRRHQLEHVAKLLKGTALPIGKITALCGFRAEKYLKRLFLRRYGMTMRAYRNANA